MSYVLLGMFVLSSLWAVLTPTLLRGAVALAAASATLTLIMFQMGAPLAGVFELSVCAGLITVVFVSTISLTTPKDKPQVAARSKARLRAFVPLFLVLAQVGLVLWLVGLPALQPAAATAEHDVRSVLWGERRLDLLGQVLMIFVGVFGVVILFKERRAKAKQEAEIPARTHELEEDEDAEVALVGRAKEEAIS